MNLDLSNLLKKKYHVFWSHALLNESLKNFLDTYLRYQLRPYEMKRRTKNNNNKKKFLLSRAQQFLFKRVFATLSRICTHKESNENFMDADYYANKIMEKKLWDIPKILDFCAIYYESNRKLVRKLVCGLFGIQTKFEEELTECSARFRYNSFKNFISLIG
jgi:activating signal cointegrator complex subunit 2